MAEALASPHECSGAAHLTAGLVRGSAVPTVAAAGASLTALRLEGPEPSVAHRCAELRSLLAGYGAAEVLPREPSLVLWREICDAAPLLGSSSSPLVGEDQGPLPRGERVSAPDRVIWRVSLPPSEAPALLRALGQSVTFGHFLDWGGGLVWLALPGGGDGGGATIRAALAGSGGHATLIAAPAALRVSVAVFEPHGAALAALVARVKDSFDPARILNPGRMHQGL
jgi:glycolate oxidase FAD binding subunit